MKLAPFSVLKRSSPGSSNAISLNYYITLLPTENTALRQSLNTWFHEHRITPRIVAECDDPALMKAMAADGRGFIPVPGVSFTAGVSCYNDQIVGRADTCRISFYAITNERMIDHPAVHQITHGARVMFRD